MDQPIFQRSSWYVAAFDGKIDQTPLARTLLNEPIVLNRTVDGTVIALEDRCCQRALPLPLGKIVGENIQCGYHGLMFDATGACIDVPGQSKISAGRRSVAYPLVERWNWVWIWMGYPALADDKLIPNWRTTRTG